MLSRHSCKAVEWLDKCCVTPWCWVWCGSILPLIMNWALDKFILLKSICCHSLVTTGSQISSFSLFTHRGKTIKFKVDEDKQFSLLRSGSWFVSLHLSPGEVFPHSWKKQNKTKHLDLTGAWLVEPFLPARSPQARQCRKEGSSVTLDKVPVPPTSDKRSLGHSSHYKHRLLSQCRVHMVLLTKQKTGWPWKPANWVLEITRATFLELFKQSKVSKWIIRGFAPS